MAVNNECTIERTILSVFIGIFRPFALTIVVQFRFLTTNYHFDFIKCAFGRKLNFDFLNTMAWKIAQSPLVNEVIVVPGNAGMKSLSSKISRARVNLTTTLCTSLRSSTGLLEVLYVGVDAASASAWARGAVLGQMLGSARPLNKIEQIIHESAFTGPWTADDCRR